MSLRTFSAAPALDLLEQPSVGGRVRCDGDRQNEILEEEGPTSRKLPKVAKKLAKAENEAEVIAAAGSSRAWSTQAKATVRRPGASAKPANQ